MMCNTNCARLNLSTCSFRTVYRTPSTQVSSDSDGCFLESAYLGEGDRQTQYLQFAQIMTSVTILISMLGLAGNILSIVIFATQELQNCFSTILIALNICDSLHLIFAILDGIRNDYDSAYPDFLLWIFPFFHYPLYRITMCCSNFLVMAVTMERYFAVCRPLHFREVQSKPWRSTAYILPCVVAAVTLNISRFWETEIIQKCWDLSLCGCGNSSRLTGSRLSVRPTNLRRHKDYVLYYQTWVWGLATCFVPMCSLGFLNTRIFLAINKVKRTLRTSAQGGISLIESTQSEKRKKQQRNDFNLTVILFAIVLSFFFFNIPRVIVSIYEAVTIQNMLKCSQKRKGYYKIWYLYLQATLQLLQVISSSHNVLIYLCVGNAFKEKTKKIRETLAKKVDKFRNSH